MFSERGRAMTNNLKNILPLFTILFVCVFDGYSMMTYRLQAKRSYLCFAAVTVFCLILNSYIIITRGTAALYSLMLITIGLPYFFLILYITKDTISQTVFNFWLWINIYGIIANFSEFVNDFTLQNDGFLTGLKLVLFCAYFVLYNKFLKTLHRRLIEKLSVNWWIFSFIPMFFTILICLINLYFRDTGRSGRYSLLLAAYILMAFVYILIFYTFKTAYRSAEKQKLAQNMKEQIMLQKRQYELYLQKADAERIFRHDARHRDNILLNLLENGDINGAKELLGKELCDIQINKGTTICENALINAVLIEYCTKAKSRGIEVSAKIGLPQKLGCDEPEFCVMLSNLLENSIAAAKSYINISAKQHNSQISLNIKNDYSGTLKKDADGGYATTKSNGSGLGLKSVAALVKNNGGFLKITDTDGVFDVSATLKSF